MKAKRKVKFKKPLRNNEGQFKKGCSGNPKGRSKDGYSRTDELWDAVHCVEVEKKKPWLRDIIRRSYTDTPLAIALLNRLFPALKSIELSGGLLNAVLPEESAAAIQKELKRRYG